MGRVGSISEIRGRKGAKLRVLATPTPAPPPTAQPDGYDIILFYGDSLVNKGNTRNVGDVYVAGADHFSGPDASIAGQPYSQILQSVPNWANHGDGVDRAKLAEFFGIAYLDEIPANRKVLCVTMGRSGQTLFVSPANLAVGSSRYTEAVSLFNAAITAAKIPYAGCRVRGIVLAAGTNDANDGGSLDQSGFQTAYGLLATSLRADVTEASEAAIMFQGPAPGPSDADKVALRTSQTNLVGILDNAAIIDVTGTTWSDNTHADLDADRTIAGRAAPQLAAMAQPQKVAAFSIAPVTGAALDSDIDSAAFMVRGIGVGVSATLTVSGGSTAIAPVDDPTNFGAFSSGSKTVHWGDMVKVRAHSSASEGTLVTATATITGPVDNKSADFGVTTLSSGGTDYLIFGIPGDFADDNGKLMASAEGAYLETV